jgi:hypothetical protein
VMYIYMLKFWGTIVICFFHKYDDYYCVFSFKLNKTLVYLIGMS